MTKFTRDSAIGFLKAINEKIPADIKLNKYLLRALSKARISIDEIVQEVVKREEALSTDETKAYDRERMEIIKEYALKGEDGLPIVENDNVTIPQDVKDIVAQKLDNIYNLHNMGEAEEKRKEFVEFLKEEIEVDLVKITIDQLPDELDIQTYQILSMFVEE